MRLLVLFASVLTASGCLSNAVEPAATPPHSTPDFSAPTASENPIESAKSPRPKTEEIPFEVDPDASVSANDGGILASEPARFDVAGNLTGVVAELTWSVEKAIDADLKLALEGTGGDAVGTTTELASARGPSPLRIALEKSALKSEHVYVWVNAGGDPASVSVKQKAVLHLTRFEGIPFDANFTAVKK